MASTSYTECYVFIDDSNLWIEGQKARAKKLVDADNDPRFRVDLGKFLNLVAKDYHISKAFLYGSVPPPNDTVWKAAREKNYDVKTFQRSGSGREKEVDVAMASDIIQELYQTESTVNVTFIVVTGDRDLKPPIKKTLEKTVPVELWSWENSMALEFRRMANNNPLFTAKKLDDVQDKFGYTAYMSSRKKMDIDPGHAIVYKDVPKGKRFQYKMANHIARLLRIFYFTSIEKEETQDIIVEFPHSKPDVVFQQLRKLGGFDYQPCSYPEYTHQVQGHPPIQTTNRFQALGEIDDEPPLEALTRSMSLDLDSIDESELSAENECEERNEDDWASVVRRKPGMLTRMKKRKEEQCKWRDHCVMAAHCPYSHTQEEKRLFDRFPRIRFKYFKAKLCNKLEAHHSPALMRGCAYAHTSEDSWCLRCKMYGHLTDNCIV